MARIVGADPDSLKAASAVVRRGGLIVFPTDTVYGLGCNPTDPAAVERLFEAKRRDPKPVPVLCASLDVALKFVYMGKVALQLASANWPGALTIVAPLRVNLPFPVHQGSGTLGVRVPNSQVCLSLLVECGGALTGTSANLSGSPSSRTAEEAERQLGWAVDLILDGGRLEGLESTIVRVVGDKIEAIRRGPVRVTDET